MAANASRIRKTRASSGNRVEQSASAERTRTSQGRVANALAVEPEVDYGMVTEHTSGAGVFVFSFTVFALVFAGIMLLGRAVAGTFALGSLIAAFLLAVLSVMCVHIAQEWERVVVLRFGKMNRVAGPGLFFTIPVIEQLPARIDLRVRATAFGAEETLTADLVPIDVSAVLFWVVYDAKAACTEVHDFSRSVQLAAQAALRDAIGRAYAAEVTMRREQLDRELKRVLAEQVEPWGVDVVSVRVRDILLPKELQDAMSKEAQAEQRRKARVTLMEAEQDIAEMIGDISRAYDADETAMRIRAMHLLYESIAETGGTVVVPSSFSEGFGDVLPDSGKDLVKQALQ